MDRGRTCEAGADFVGGELGCDGSDVMTRPRSQNGV